VKPLRNKGKQYLAELAELTELDQTAKSEMSIIEWEICVKSKELYNRENRIVCLSMEHMPE
jgi:hypothetical protein